MNFLKIQNNEATQGMRSDLYAKLTAPVDAMWELLYIANADDYLINVEGDTIGYCSVDAEKVLLQMYLKEEHSGYMHRAISTLIEAGLVNTARLSSNEPITFNTSLALSKGIEVNTYCFQHTNAPVVTDAAFNIQLVSEADIPEIKDFLKAQVGMNDTFGYTENLVARKEIFMIKESGLIIATSERRVSDTQAGIADLGIIVNRDFRGQGIATKVMQMQVNRVLEEGRKPICSTTVDNIGSKKAIERAGFYCSNIIFNIQFKNQ